ncbi:MAG: hypothetical protein M3Y45_09500, partial [Actinomycetota bacterium]|nr:hypothetical protein [Actinomycetota bacterium]
MNSSRPGRLRSARTFKFLPVAFLASILLLLGFSAPASAEYTGEQRKEYFDSGKYGQDLGFVAERARKFIIERTQPTIKIVRACKAKNFRIGKVDPGPDPAADYTVPVAVPKNRLPDRIVKAPKPGPGPLTNPKKPRVKKLKAFKAKRITRKRCGNLPKLAIAMDMDETVSSSFAYGTDAEVYDNRSAGGNLAAG